MFSEHCKPNSLFEIEHLEPFNNVFNIYGHVSCSGYVPPEYRDKGVISLKFDIFSLGVVIIKIMGRVDAYYRREEKSPQEFIEDVWKVVTFYRDQLYMFQKC